MEVRRCDAGIESSVVESEDAYDEGEESVCVCVCV